MRVLCPYYVKKNTWKQCCIDRCVVVSFQFELKESIVKQNYWLSIYFIHFDCYFALNQNMVLQSVLKSQNCTLFRILHSYPEVKRLSQIIYHYWTIPLNLKSCECNFFCGDERVACNSAHPSLWVKMHDSFNNKLLLLFTTLCWYYSWC